MKKIEQYLTSYAAYHRDPRNLTTHFFGIPLIVLSILVLMAQTSWQIAEVTINLSLIVVLFLSAFYLSLNRIIGLIMLVLLLPLLVVADILAAHYSWLLGVPLFVVGWVLQFIGHYYEGKKPAFVDDISGLIIGPLFVVVEWLFHFGFFAALKATIEAEVGPLKRHTN
ncbi:DUF962 domain-containing protein [Pseudoalteromonas tunicata]|jgi:uncharacterized membrane protein YGL010W|uniref:PRS2 protein n=1 Tax=Pseudoalteromonas tunicata D2 TaxID=87626 RepID=A4C3Y2_9GAMM|nr:Mpo1-like protein [Pseudoalteromonas tunicata]ATC97251.1 hypothetical protein PTUN_b0936 [Pseudoalteromonas tunicata]AXT33333.1 DUF962 domain-containing protein [Pseudoalteromonas tunicata]EAR30264.1 hypothetical protein PTD2_01806 [Pseudoalteromonas tunicata D2]